MRYWLILIALLVTSAADARNPRGGAVSNQTGTPLVSVAGLHVSGKSIVNSGGQVVPLRGVTKDGTEYMCLSSANVFDGPSDSTDITNMGSWAIDIVRLPVNEQCWLGINGLPSGSTATAYQNAIIAYVNALTAANIATIIDLQWAAPGTKLANQLIPMPDADHASSFWTSVANTFKGNLSVIFDLYNEPYPDSNQDTTAAWTCLRDGCSTVVDPHDSTTYTAAGMQSLVNAIRATGSTNVIMSPGVQFTNTLTQWTAYKPTDATGNLVAAWHSYATQICNNQTCWDANIAPILNTTPVITGEIGENDCAHTYVDSLMTYLDAKGGNYLAWAWNTYDCSSFPSVISEYPGATPTGFGVGIRDHLLIAAGRTPPPLPPVPYFSNTYPFGIAVGSSTNFTAADGTVYYADVPATGLTENMQFFTTFTTADTITGTADPNLYKKGRQGNFGAWTINVPNGNYTVTLGMAPNSTYTAGPYGQDQTINGQQVGTCIWSSFSGTHINPTDNLSCPQTAVPIPSLDVALTVSYTVSVFGQQLVIQPAASFGGGRTTILNSIKIAQAP